MKTVPQARSAKQGRTPRPCLALRACGPGEPMSQPNDPPPVIDWAIEHAHASLRVGVSRAGDRKAARRPRPRPHDRGSGGDARPCRSAREKTEPYESETSRNAWLFAMVAVGCGCVFLAFCTGGVISAAWGLLLVAPVLGYVWFAQRSGVRGGIFLLRALVWLVLLLMLVYRLILIYFLP